MKKIFTTTFLILFISISYCQSLIRDNSFGNQGIVNTEYQYNSGDSVYKIIMLDDHKFIGIGSSKIVRFNENGTIDSSFGVNGTFQVAEASVVIYNVQLIDGYFYFLGSTYNNPATYGDGFIMRVTYDGELDTTFANNGSLIFNINENEAFYNIAVTEDNKIMAFGIKKTDPWQKLFVAKFNEDGSIDSNFQNAGFKEIYVFPIATGYIENVSAIENGKIIVACTGKMNIYSNYSQLALIKLDTDGNFDLTFNDTGKIIFSPDRPFYFNVKFVGNYLYVRNIDNDIYADEYTATLFKINLSDFSRQATIIDRDSFDYFIHEDSSISTLSMNRDFINTYPNRNLFIKKYTPEGNLDFSFCNTGIYEFNLSDINNYNTDDIPRNFIFYDDKILVLGRSQIPQSGINAFSCVFTRFTQITLDSETFQQDSISISPNPASEFIHVNLENVMYPAKIEVFNLVGQKVYETTVFDDQNTNQINVSSFESNIYIVKIIDANSNVYEQKFVKK